MTRCCLWNRNLQSLPPNTTATLVGEITTLPIREKRDADTGLEPLMEGGPPGARFRSIPVTA